MKNGECTPYRVCIFCIRRIMKNRGKQFENQVRLGLEKVDGISVDRIKDTMGRYKGNSNICDFVVYKYPHQFYIECKSHHGATFPFSCIRENQWSGLIEKSKIEGVISGVLIWWEDYDVTRFIPIQLLQYLKDKGDKSIRYDCDWCMGIPGEKPFTFKTVYKPIDIQGTKKKILFDYDFSKFFEIFEK